MNIDINKDETFVMRIDGCVMRVEEIKGYLEHRPEVGEFYLADLRSRALDAEKILSVIADELAGLVGRAR